MTLFHPTRFLKSVRYAIAGFRYTLAHEQNFRVHVFAALIVLLFALVFRVEVWEAIVLLLVTMSVLILEILNTIFEKLTDLVKPRIHHYVGVIKDLMAAAVLLAACGAVIIGTLIFYPYIRDLFK